MGLADLGLQLRLQACHRHGAGRREKGQLFHGHRWELGSALPKGGLATSIKVMEGSHSIRLNSLFKNGGGPRQKWKDG